MSAVITEWANAFRALPWPVIKEALDLGLYYLAVIAVIGALFRLKTISRVLRDFLEARGPLWELQRTVAQLKELEPSIINLQSQVALMDERLAAATKQVTELQAESISSRSEGDDVDPDPQAPPPVQTNTPDEQDHNWNQLREYWQRNRKRIEFVIDQIEDGRTRLAYDRLPRTSYTRIIHKLQGQKLITAAAANASKELNDTFNRYRPRNKSIPDEVLGALFVLDGQLEKELVPFASVLAAEEGDVQSGQTQRQVGERAMRALTRAGNPQPTAH
jgi:hypothetical protein